MKTVYDVVKNDERVAFYRKDRWTKEYYDPQKAFYARLPYLFTDRFYNSRQEEWLCRANMRVVIEKMGINRGKSLMKPEEAPNAFRICTGGTGEMVLVRMDAPADDPVVARLLSVLEYASLDDRYLAEERMEDLGHETGRFLGECFNMARDRRYRGYHEAAESYAEHSGREKDKPASYDFDDYDEAEGPGPQEWLDCFLEEPWMADINLDGENVVALAMDCVEHCDTPEGLMEKIGDLLLERYDEDMDRISQGKPPLSKGAGFEEEKEDAPAP